MNQHEKKEASKFAQVLRAGRKSRDVSQVELSSAIGISQGQLSKLEKGVTVPSAPIWFCVCDKLNIQSESGTLGYIDGLRDVSLSSSNYQGSFKIPKRYSHLQGSMNRTSRPLLAYLLKQAGTKKTEEFIRAQKLDPDYFALLDHPLNVNFNFDVIRHLLSSGLLKAKNISELAALSGSSKMHGAMTREYKKGQSARDLMDTFQKNTRKYSVNWDYGFDFSRKNTVEIVTTPAAHMKEFDMDEKELGGFISEYTKHFLLSLFEENNIKVDPAAIQIKNEGNFKCVYRMGLQNTHA